MIRFGSMKALMAIAAIGLVNTVAPAQQPIDKTGRPTIRVSGEATVTAKPDQAEINIGVVTQAATGQAAATQNAQKQDAVLSELRKLLGAAADIKTISYSLTPNYRYPKEGGQPTIAGYTASNVVQVKTNDLAQVGKVIDIATQSGANTVQSLRFTLKDEQGVRSQALREAAIKARAKADALASALGLKIVRVLHVDEGGVSMPIPMAARTFSAEANVAQTPVESGTIDVHATVTLTVEIAQ
ncbi:MAG: SIMPL domain-containing protein [Blastocatellia bacterium]